MTDTSIQWTDKTWNPVTGCSKVSQGCKNCYAEGVADRFFAKQYPPNADGSLRVFADVRCHEDRLEQPLHWRKPCRIFVNSMSDLFHEDVPEEFIDQVFAVMAICSGKHKFQILTKRPARMLEYANQAQQQVWDAICRTPHKMVNRVGAAALSWPLPNVWLGVSVEDQKNADERIPLLLQTPAAVRFLSVEPMIEPVSLRWLAVFGQPYAAQRKDSDTTNHLDGLRKIDWVICGGESGPESRPFDISWAESLLGECREAGVPFFMKQIGRDARWFRKGISSPMPLKDRKGGDTSEWPEHLRVREFPQ